MKAIKNMLYIAAMATAITACTAEESLAPQADQPITVSATMPGEVWATASRASSMGTLDKTDYSEVELHYTDYKGEISGARSYTPPMERWIVHMEDVDGEYNRGEYESTTIDITDMVAPASVPDEWGYSGSCLLDMGIITLQKK